MDHWIDGLLECGGVAMSRSSNTPSIQYSDTPTIQYSLEI